MRSAIMIDHSVFTLAEPGGRNIFYFFPPLLFMHRLVKAVNTLIAKGRPV